MKFRNSELYEGRYVVPADGQDSTRYLILEITPKSLDRVVYEAREEGVSLSEICPFWFDYVPEGEYPDYEGHIRSCANLSEYRLAEMTEE